MTHGHFFENAYSRIDVCGGADELWRYTVKSTGRSFAVAGPAFEVDGTELASELTGLQPGAAPVRLRNGCTEYTWTGRFRDNPDISLDIAFRLAEDNPVVRFRYTLRADGVHRLTKTSGRDRLVYLGLSLANLPDAKELRFSEFIEMVHSFSITEHPLDGRAFDNELSVMGPLLLGSDGTHSLLAGYEHGSQVPDAFVRFALGQDRSARMEAVKGSYYDGERLDGGRSYATLWLQFAAVDGDENALARSYRTFVLERMTMNAESRKPYIFYNTWNFQERNKHWYGNPYLSGMTEARMLEEIEVAHRMGVDVFVIDTGWYEKTGDWRVSGSRFPHGMRPIKEKLDGYGMKLGLWFNPTVAAVSSGMLDRHRDCVMSWNGKPSSPWPVWETEESVSLCLVSRYADAFADELIRLVREVGVTYFKWDAIGQYGCSDPNHDHGDGHNSDAERADCYAFRQPAAMAHIIDRLCEACPEAIVDFDITEGHRAVGLGFLSAGKYFLVNNGPYYQNYDVPIDPNKDNWNLFFHPGPARGWICRTPLTYDKWFPSVLFLTHYLPDDPRDNQLMSLGSLILGQNGIWGDLPAVSAEGVALFGETLMRYKRVRDDITAASPVRSGLVGGCPEVHEKINPATGRGAVVLFASTAGTYTYVTERQAVDRLWHTENVRVTRDASGRAVITADFDRPSARIVLFGVE